MQKYQYTCINRNPAFSNSPKRLYKQIKVGCTHHVPLGTYVRSRSEDDQQTNVIGQLKEILQVPVPTEVVLSGRLFMVVPGDVPSTQDNISQNARGELTRVICRQTVLGDTM